jgi:hypothetical protein
MAPVGRNSDRRGAVGSFVRGRSLAWFLVYLAASAAVLGGVGYLLHLHRADLFGLIERYLLPEGWRFAARQLVERFLGAQLREVLVNATVGASLALVSLLLFPLKEHLSAVVEREARLTSDPPRELPLWLQGVEEVWLFVLFATAQLSIFWLGYTLSPFRQNLARVLSYAVLFAQFGVDFISPTLQRHGQRYATILKLLALHPVRLFAFGALFTLPSILAGRWAGAHPEWSFPRAVGVMFGANALCIALAAVAGTFVGAGLLPAARRTRRPHAVTRIVVALLVLFGLGHNLRRYGAVALSLHHKSQILKCRYTLVPASLHIRAAGFAGLWQKGVALHLDGDVEVENPTRFDVAIERNRLEAQHDGALVARTSLAPVAVPAGQTRVVHLALPIQLDGSLLSRGRALLDPARWSITLYLAVLPDFELPIYLVKGPQG